MIEQLVITVAMLLLLGSAFITLWLLITPSKRMRWPERAPRECGPMKKDQ